MASMKAPVHLTRRQFLTLTLAGLAPCTDARAEIAVVQDEIWNDTARDRNLPVRIRWPDTTRSAPPQGWPVVLFSHGLGGTRDGGRVWGEAWAAGGLVVIHLQHPGSDLDAVRHTARSFSDRAGLLRAATPQQLLARLRDVGFVLDETARRCANGQGRWATVRPHQVGMSGHSFGAHTTLGVAGQIYPGGLRFPQERLGSFVAFSPTLPPGDAPRALSAITRPMLCITGTRDADVVGTGATPERRAAVFDALPAGRKAQLVLQDADHMSFAGQTDRAVEILPREPITRELQARHHALVAGSAAITTDWWRATLRDDGAARGRLQRPTGLAAGDVWSQA